MSSLCVIVAAYLLSSPAPKFPDAAAAERQRWQGVWKIVQMEITTGERTARLKFADDKDATLRVKDDALEIAGLMFPYTTAKVSFDPTGEPKRMTLRLLDGTKKGPTVEGTYIRDGDGIELELPKWPRDKDETVKLRLSLKRVKE